MGVYFDGVDMERFDSWEAAGFSEGSLGNIRKYDWNEVTDGSIWQAKQGEDFTCTTASFQNQVRNQAKTRHLKAHIEIRDKTVRFQFSKEN